MCDYAAHSQTGMPCDDVVRWDGEGREISFVKRTDLSLGRVHDIARSKVMSVTPTSYIWLIMVMHGSSHHHSAIIIQQSSYQDQAKSCATNGLYLHAGSTMPSAPASKISDRSLMHMRGH